MTPDNLLLKIGAPVGTPPPGHQTFFVDTDGALKSIDSAGSKASVGGAIFITTRQVLDLTVGQTISNVIPAQTGKHFTPLLIIYDSVTNSGVSVAAVVNIGNNASTFNNMAAALTIGGSFTAGSLFQMTMAGFVQASIDVGTTAASLKVTTPGTATSLTGAFTVMGFYW